MSEDTGGMGAEVGVRKIDSGGNTVQEEGAISSKYSRTAWFIFGLMVVLSTFGVWKIFDIIILLF